MMKPPTRMKATSTVTLMATMTLLNFADSETPTHQQNCQCGADEECRKIENENDWCAVHAHVDAIVLQVMTNRSGQMCGYVQTDVAEQTDHVARPADRDDGGREAIFEQEQRAHDPGGELADGRVAVGVGRPRHRKRRGKLGVAEAGERADDAGDQRRK